MSKSMKLEEVQDFLETTVGYKSVDSFSGLIAILGTIPGIKTPSVTDDDGISLTGEEEAMKANLAILAKVFEEESTTKNIKLRVQYPWVSSSVDYEIGFTDPESGEFVCIASGLFSDIVRKSNAT